MDHDTVYERLAAALAALTDPDLDDASTDDQLSAMQAVDDVDGPDPGWLQWLIDRVSTLSDGATQAVPTGNDRFAVKEPGAIYLEMVRADRMRLAVLGRFVPPLQYQPEPPPELAP